MANEIYRGGNVKLLGQFEDELAVPPDVPGAIWLKYSEMNFDRKPVRPEDPTINAQTLAEKTDEVDETPSATLKAIMDLNEVGFWLKAALGAPVTTGAAGAYVHTFTLNLDDLPSILFEQQFTRAGGERYNRYLGGMLNKLSWDALTPDQSWNGDLIFCREVRPVPTAAWDDTPSKIAKLRACSSRGLVYDVLGASTLGRISGASIELDNALEGLSEADGLRGYGFIDRGRPKLTGSIKALMQDGTIIDHARNHVSKPIVIKTASIDDSASMIWTIPHVEFEEPSSQVNTTKGLVVDVKWSAHYGTGDNPVTVVLRNSIPSY